MIPLFFETLSIKVMGETQGHRVPLTTQRVTMTP